MTNWGSSTIQMGSGIRQGASLHMFAAVVDWILQSVGRGAQGQGTTRGWYVDDMLVWHGARTGLQICQPPLPQFLPR